MNWPAMRNSHAVHVCIALLMFPQRLSRRYWMLFKQSADIIIKGHHELAGCAVWKLRAKETDGLWRRRKTIFKVNTATKCAVWPHLLHSIELQIASCTKKHAAWMQRYERKSWKWCYSQNNNTMIMCSLTHKSTFDLFWNLSALLKRLLHHTHTHTQRWNCGVYIKIDIVLSLFLNLLKCSFTPVIVHLFLTFVMTVYLIHCSWLHKKIKAWQIQTSKHEVRCSVCVAVCFHNPGVSKHY